MSSPGSPDTVPGIVMLCTASRGGMRAVVESYAQRGLFERWRIRWIVTHLEGSLWARLGRAFAAARELQGLLAAGRVAAVHAHVAMRGSFWRKAALNALARRHHVPVLLHLHGSEFERFYATQPAWVQRRIAREFERATSVFVLSESWRLFVTGLAPKAVVRVLPNFVTLPDLRDVTRGDAESVSVLFLGAVGLRKGIYDLLRALAAAAVHHPSIRLVVGGNGDVKGAERLARELGIEQRVRFCGWVGEQQKVALLASCDVYALPSYNEGLPISVLEAMAWGLPVITTPVGGIPELIEHDVHGCLVEPGNIGRLAEALIRLASDEPLRRSMGAAGRLRVAERHSPDAVLGTLETVYAEITAQRAARVLGLALRPSTSGREDSA